MRLGDLKIGTQLRLGLGAILLFAALLATTSWLQTSRLWLQTEGLYNHPHKVSKAIGKLEVEIERMSRNGRDLFLAKSERETEQALQALESSKAEAERQFAVIQERYLGPRADVVALHDEVGKWNVLRDETIRLLRSGKPLEAEARIRPGGSQTVQAEAVRGRLAVIDEFARKKGDQFYREACEQRAALRHHLAVAFTVILALVLLVSGFLMSSVRTPLARLTDAAEHFHMGKLGVRCEYASANEFGALSASFNAMAAAIQTEMRINESAAQLAGVMLREEEVHAFCRELLKALLQHTGSQVGAVYFLNEAKTAFEHFESIGLAADRRAAFSALELEGEVGVALATRQIQRVTDIPEDTRFAFAAVSGTFMPREIITIPVLSEGTVTAIISLASVHAYTAQAIRLVDEVCDVLVARVNGVLAFRRVQDLAAQLENQNRELDAQKRELAAQADELAEQNAELEMQKRQVDEASRLKSAFLSNMSHELRTPLNSVIALSGVLNRRLANAIPAEEHNYLEVIERNGKNLLAMINDILDLSRVEAGKEGVSVSRFALREVAGEVVAMLEAQARDKGIALSCLVGDDLPMLVSDSDKCRHILQNLVGNAVKFTEAGSVEIAARLVGGELHVAVRDTGIGIAAGQLPHIFDEFRQADEGTARKYGGTGLGLAIAKRYAELLGGAIEVESAPGQGSTFTFRVPLAVGDAEAAPTAIAGERAAAEQADGSAPHARGEGKTLLLVEDNGPAIIQLTDILHAEGYRVCVAHNGKEALALLGEKPPEAVILDLMMPEIDGFHVLRSIRDVERTAHLPVLILTAKHVTKEELSFLKNNHIHQLIQKGDISRDGLLSAVARMVAPPPAEPAPARPRRRPARPGRPVVLVVEDNPDNLLTAQALLKDHFQVLAATDGQAGVELALAHRPDVILTDIALQVLDGFEVLAAVRRAETLRNTPVIAVTASAMKGDRDDILARGFDGYISKPIDRDVLMQTLRAFLQGDGCA
jgi:signal transduction histidine kinase/DNA-binding response OmpR family regulator/HAMP domain-containing protein